MMKFLKAAQHKGGARQQNHRQRDLRNHQNAPQSMAARSNA